MYVPFDTLDNESIQARATGGETIGSAYAMKMCVVPFEQIRSAGA